MQSGAFRAWLATSEWRAVLDDWPVAGREAATVMQPIARYLEQAGMSVEGLARAAALDEKLVKAVVSGNFNPGPTHRQRLAAALGVETDEISWGHAVPVEHMRGNGPQSGRPT